MVSPPNQTISEKTATGNEILSQENSMKKGLNESLQFPFSTLLQDLCEQSLGFQGTSSQRPPGRHIVSEKCEKYF